MNSKIKKFDKIPKGHEPTKNKFFDELEIGEGYDAGEGTREVQQSYGSTINRYNKSRSPKKFVGRITEGRFYIFRDEDVKE